jgi:hypothetical protein
VSLNFLSGSSQVRIQVHNWTSRVNHLKSLRTQMLTLIVYEPRRIWEKFKDPRCILLLLYIYKEKRRENLALGSHKD